MSKVVYVKSADQLQKTLSENRIVVADYYADWCGPCKAIAPQFEKMANTFTKPKQIAFMKIDIDNEGNRPHVTSSQVTSVPTFMIYQNGTVIDRIAGANPQKLAEWVKKLQAESSSDGTSSVSGGFSSSSAGSSSKAWLGGKLPRGHSDASDQVDIKGLDLLNADSEFGGVRTLFTEGKPSGLSTAKGKEKAEGEASEDKDWIESDTDDQLMLFIPLQSTMKVHSLQITSAVSKSTDEDSAPEIGRPGKLRLYINRAHNLAFEDGESLPPTQEIILADKDWDETTATANVELRFVKFQHVTSLTCFVVNSNNGAERVRIDRVRVIGEVGEKRQMGKLEKIGDEPGE